MRAETQAEWEERIGREIIEYLCSEIYTDLRFLDSVLNLLTPRTKEGVNVFATQGTFIYFNPVKIIDLFKKNEKYLMRAYLHTIFHCVYCHLWQRNSRIVELWNVACDIAVEKLIDGINKPCTRRILNWCRQRTYKELDERNAVSAAQIYNYLLELSADGKEDLVNELKNEFYTDDHFFWPKEEKIPPFMKNNDDVRKKWEEKARQLMQKKAEKNGKDAFSEVALTDIAIDRRKISYRDFLRKFSVFTEEMRCDEEEFDLNYYMFGLEKYKDMPLIEPLETKEDRYIRDFVVVIDTSYSTNGELVKRFITETFSILCQDNTFSRGNRIHIIQCDDKVREDIEIFNRNDLDLYFSEFKVKGGGNTDFRPAFEYVNELMGNKKLKKPDGLIYFTDGKGIYPKQAPEYKTAFVFVKEYDESNVPVWAMKGEFV